MPRYTRPPLHEITAEFRFRPGEAWDLTIPGLLYEQLRGLYPQKRTGRRLELQTRMVDGQVVPLVRDQSGEIQFISKDGRAGVRLDVDQLAFQHAGAYPGWLQLRDEIQRTLHSYTEIAGPSAFEQLRLHFVNRIDLSRLGQNVDISRYLTVWPRLPNRLATTFGKFLLKVDLPEPALRGHLVLTTGIAEPAAPQQGVGLILDLDFISVPGPLPLEDSEAWLDGAHRRMAEAFELCITDDARAVFEAQGEAPSAS